MGCHERIGIVYLRTLSAFRERPVDGVEQVCVHQVQVPRGHRCDASDGRSADRPRPPRSQPPAPARAAPEPCSGRGGSLCPWSWKKAWDTGASTVFPAADAELKSLPLGTTPALGTLVGPGLYVTQLAYGVTNSARALLFRRFGGLITSASVTLSKHHAVQLEAREAGLWGVNSPRNRILAAGATGRTSSLPTVSSMEATWTPSSSLNAK